MIFFNTDKFIKDNITKRSKSLFTKDLDRYSPKLLDLINNKDVLVIGGAGTIGSSYIKALLKYKPASLIVVDYNENGLTELTRDLRSNNEITVPKKYITYPFDFGGPVFKKLIKNESFDIIACFAAHKHVRSEKDHLAIEAMVNNNVFNTYNLLELVKNNPPKHFFSVSTDKAANPVNVMGASKKLMEKVLLSYSDDFKINTARFANVAFSNGSLLFGFIQRIMKRQPLSSPNDVKRYFVSPIESGELCLIASLLGKTGEIFFPKLNEDQMMTFSTIAELFLKEIGLECDYCNSETEAKDKAKVWDPSVKEYPVYFFKTDTSGEKSYEEFFTKNDSVDLESFRALGKVTNSQIPKKNEVNNILEEFESLFKDDSISKSDIINLINSKLPDFNHIETGKSLDQKM